MYTVNGYRSGHPESVDLALPRLRSSAAGVQQPQSMYMAAKYKDHCWFFSGLVRSRNFSCLIFKFLSVLFNVITDKCQSKLMQVECLVEVNSFVGAYIKVQYAAILYAFCQKFMSASKAEQLCIGKRLH